MTKLSPQTPPKIVPGAAALESLLEQARERVHARVAEACAVAADENGQARDAADAFAIRLFKAAAKVGMALGKVGGTQTVNIVVTRREEAPPPPPVVYRVSPTAEMEEHSRLMYEEFAKTNELRRKLLEKDAAGELVGQHDYVETQDGELVPLPEVLKVYDAHRNSDGAEDEGEGNAISGGSNAGN
jgi:hypothetical protein